MLTGRVDKGGAPVEGVEVTLHRVTPDSSGVIATGSTDQAGGFSFLLPPPDTTGFTVYFATANYQSVRYFGRPLHENEATDGYRVEVFDTTSAASLAEGVRTTRRDLVMIPQTGGGWEVNEIVRIRNNGAQTLVPRSGMPTWELEIPEEAESFEAGEGESLPNEITRVGNRVFLISPLIPGPRELFLRYRLPARASESVLRLQNPTDTFNIFVRQPSPRVSVSGLTTTDVLAVQGERFLQFGATDLGADGSITVKWEGASGPPVSPITAAITLSMALLVGGAWAAYRRRPL